MSNQIISPRDQCEVQLCGNTATTTVPYQGRQLIVCSKCKRIIMDKLERAMRAAGVKPPNGR